MAKNPANWEYSGAMKAGGHWGYFETHLPTGISRFVALNHFKTKKDVMIYLQELDKT